MSLCTVHIVNLFIDQKTGTPVVLLKDDASGDVLPIMIAPLEASLIAIELEGQKPARPLCHDLIVNMLDALTCRVISIVITDLKNSIYYAQINLESHRGPIAVDSRPSDAIAIALRTGAPLFVNKKVFAQCMGIEKACKTADPKTLKEMLEEMSIDDMEGKCIQ